MRYINRRLALTLLCLTMLLTLAVAAQAQSTGILEGQVVNGTAAGMEIGADLPVTLHVLQGDTLAISLETTTDDDGRFRFEGLDTDANLEYWPEVGYAQVSYTSVEPYQFDGDQTTLSPVITVYETTDDDSAVGLNSVHFIAESFGEMLRISEIHLFGNSGDRTYIGSAGDTGQLTTVSVPLPQNAVGLAFDQQEAEERFVETEAGLLDTEPVPPGSETSLLFFSYHLVVDDDTIPLERRFAYPVSTLSMLVAQPGLTLSSDHLEARGPETFQGRQYDFFVTQDLAPDTPLVMELSPVAEMPAAQDTEASSAAVDQNAAGASTRGYQGLLRWLGLGLAGLAVIGVIVYSLTGKRSTSASASSPNLAADPKAQRLLSELADLEAGFEAGQVDEATYERQRAEIYDALKSLRA